MNLTEQRITGNDQIYLSDALNASLLELKLKKVVNTISPDIADLKIYIDKQSKANPSDKRREYVFSLNNILNSYVESETAFYSDEFTIKMVVENNDIIMKTKVIRKVGIDNNEITYLLDANIIEEIDSCPIVLFEGDNYIYTNYNGIDIELVYAKDTDENRMLLNSAIYYSHRMNNTGDFSLDNIYFKDAFTKTNNKLNLEVDSINVSCLTSKNNKFSLDDDGNLVVNSIAFNETNMPNTSIYNQMYPIGSIYLSVNNTNPTNLFGGTWMQLKDKFLLGAGDIYVNGDIGGEATHTLTVDEIPSHKHGLRAINQVTANNSTQYPYFLPASYKGYTTGTIQDLYDYAYETKINGGGEHHNNMPPYLVVYMWQRIA